jgi:hypothetical protein
VILPVRARLRIACVRLCRADRHRRFGMRFSSHRFLCSQAMLMGLLWTPSSTSTQSCIVPTRAMLRCVFLKHPRGFLSVLAELDVRHILDFEFAEPTRIENDLAFAAILIGEENIGLADHGVADHWICKLVAATMHSKKLRDGRICRPRETAQRAPIRAAPYLDQIGQAAIKVQVLFL